MLLQFQLSDSSRPSPAIRAMFEARKRVFIDLLKWDVPVLAGMYEVDQYDTIDATYLVLTDGEYRHLASARLLRTDRPHILGELFPTLCEEAAPAGPTVREITQFCLEPTLTAAERRQVRNQLVTALVEHALQARITEVGENEAGGQFGDDLFRGIFFRAEAPGQIAVEAVPGSRPSDHIRESPSRNTRQRHRTGKGAAGAPRP